MTPAQLAEIMRRLDQLAAEVRTLDIRVTRLAVDADVRAVAA